MYARHRQHGLTLIELIVFIVIVSVALAGVLSVLNLTARSSADPMIRK
ncbi:MAG: type II secretion system GspH family protein, partial [Rhodocyclales bacterium]|nr:type II secretion system GspH family protein [Rhodocyclales bacterium]